VLQVSELAFVLSLLLVTRMVMLVWATKLVKKLPLLFVAPSSTQNFALSQFVVDTGVVVSVLPTLFLAKFKARVDPFDSVSSLPPEELD